jgi:hypothetical protein
MSGLGSIRRLLREGFGGELERLCVSIFEDKAEGPVGRLFRCEGFGGAEGREARVADRWGRLSVVDVDAVAL